MLITMNQILPGIWKYSFGTPERITPVSQRFTQPLKDAIQKLPACVQAPISRDDIQCEVTNRGSVFHVRMNEQEQLYGYGLQFYSHNQTGLKKCLRVNSDPSTDVGDTHAPVPLAVSTRGYALLVDSARYVTVYNGSHSHVQERCQSMADAKGLMPTDTSELYRVHGVSDKQLSFEVPACQGLSFYVFAGPSMMQAVQRYNLFSGGGCLPPLWGLGIWYRSHSHADASDVLALAREFRDRSMPCSVFGLEPGWQTKSYPCSYIWDKKRFPNDEQFIAKMKEMGYELNLWEHAFVHDDAPFSEDVAKACCPYKVFNGMVPDLLDSMTRSSFTNYHQQQLVEKGISGFKLDECDNSDYKSGPWSFPEHSQFPSGIDGEQMHSMLGALYQEAIDESFRRTNKRTYGLVRSSYALASSYPFVLYSDLYDHRAFITALTNSGFSGLLWTPEIRDCQSVEDMIRRLQLAVFSPMVLVNAWYIKNPPWKQIDKKKNNDDHFIDGYEQIESLCRNIFQWRMRLIPYLYSSMMKYQREGVPPFRAMVMEYPEDVMVYDVRDQYFCGDNLLVAPMVAGEKKRQVYLPSGQWYDFWSNKKYEGGQSYEIYCDLDQFPVFVRGNTILPIAEPCEQIPDPIHFNVEVRVYGQNPLSFTLYEDDGISYQYQKDGFNTMALSWDFQKKGRVARSGNFNAHVYNVVRWQQIQ